MQEVSRAVYLIGCAEDKQGVLKTTMEDLAKHLPSVEVKSVREKEGIAVVEMPENDVERTKAFLGGSFTVEKNFNLNLR